MVVDAHCHASSRWYEPVETLLFNMDCCGVDKAVLIPLLGSTDSTDMKAAVRAHPDRLAWFAAVDTGDPGAGDAIRSARDAGACGLRMRASWRPLDLWETARSCGLAISVVGSAASLVDGSVDELARGFPDLIIILEHLGGLARPDCVDRAAMTDPVLALAQYPNVAIKLPGLGQLAARKSSIDGDGIPLQMEGIAELVAHFIDRFGADRLMWGSDFPPVAAREGYANSLRWSRDLVAQLRPSAVGSVYGGTAVQLLAL